ncbi:MAG: aldo/keto reductase, partial [Actinomycetes bacterium]
QSAIPTRFVKETDIDFVLIAGRYTLLDQSASQDLLPAALERGVDVIAAGVFNSGILANAQPGATYDYAPAPSEVLARAQKLEAILSQFNVKLEEAAIQFPLRHAAVKVVLTGCRSALEVQANIDAFDAPIPDQAWQAIDEFLENQSEG